MAAERVLLVVPGELRRAAMRAALRDSHLEIAAEGPGLDVLSELDAHISFELLIFDRKPDDRSDLRPLANLRKSRPQVGIIVLTGSVSATDLRGLIDAGADAILERCVSLSALCSYVDVVLQGERVVNPALLQTVSPAQQDTALRRSRTSLQLSKREHSVVDLLSHGMTDKEIARELGLVHGTVRNYVRSAQRKLSLGNRTQVAVWAAQNGIAPVCTATQ